MYQDKRKEGSKLIYARAVHPETINLDKLAERIEHNCSMTKGDCLAVLTEMVTVMKHELQNSNKVCIDGLGTFYLSMSTRGVANEDLFDIGRCLKKIRVNFLAEGRKQNGTLVRTFTDNVKCQKATGYAPIGG